MEIKYKTQKLKGFLENKEEVSKTHNKVVYKVYTKAIEKLRNMDNLYVAKIACRGMNIKKLRNNESIWAFRLNKKYRVEFKANNLEMEKIKTMVITKLHPHIYVKRKQVKIK